MKSTLAEQGKTTANRIQFCRKVLKQYLSLFEKKNPGLKIPRIGHQKRVMFKQHSHLYPEVFIQISGLTHFYFPRERIRLLPGEMCIIPRNIPHSESVKPLHGPFYNVVFGFGPETMHFHFADEFKKNPGMPRGGESETFQPIPGRATINRIDEIISWHSNHGPLSNKATEGLLVIFLLDLIKIIEEDKPLIISDHPKIAQVKKLIASNIWDYKLNVGSLANWIGCTADYLSFLFHKETGEHLVTYINQSRISLARGLLEGTSLNVSEIAWMCGQKDPAYFIRLFKKALGITPKQFRKAHEGKMKGRGVLSP